LNDFSNFPITLLTIPQKFYLGEILLHTRLVKPENALYIIHITPD